MVVLSRLAVQTIHFIGDFRNTYAQTRESTMPWYSSCVHGESRGSARKNDLMHIYVIRQSLICIVFVCACVRVRVCVCKPKTKMNIYVLFVIYRPLYLLLCFLQTHTHTHTRTLNIFICRLLWRWCSHLAVMPRIFYYCLIAFRIYFVLSAHTRNLTLSPNPSVYTVSLAF